MSCVILEFILCAPRTGGSWEGLLFEWQGGLRVVSLSCLMLLWLVWRMLRSLCVVGWELGHTHRVAHASPESAHTLQLQRIRPALPLVANVHNFVVQDVNFPLPVRRSSSPAQRRSTRIAHVSMQLCGLDALSPPLCVCKANSI